MIANKAILDQKTDRTKTSNGIQSLSNQHNNTKKPSEYTSLNRN